MKILCLDHNRPFKPRTCKEEEEDEDKTYSALHVLAVFPCHHQVHITKNK
jgi:hypothetical protein